MKTMKDYMEGMLQGEMETITVSDLRSSPGDILTQVSLGKSFCIKRKEKIVAFLVHASDADVTHEVLPDGSAPTLGIGARVVPGPEGAKSPFVEAGIEPQQSGGQPPLATKGILEVPQKCWPPPGDLSRHFERGGPKG